MGLISFVGGVTSIVSRRLVLVGQVTCPKHVDIGQIDTSRIVMADPEGKEFFVMEPALD